MLTHRLLSQANYGRYTARLWIDVLQANFMHFNNLPSVLALRSI